MTHTARNSFSWKSNTETVAIGWDWVSAWMNANVANGYRDLMGIASAKHSSVDREFWQCVVQEMGTLGMCRTRYWQIANVRHRQ